MEVRDRHLEFRSAVAGREEVAHSLNEISPRKVTVAPSDRDCVKTRVSDNESIGLTAKVAKWIAKVAKEEPSLRSFASSLASFAVELMPDHDTR